MKTATFTDFRKHAAAFFNEVEKGETVRVLRHGKPIATIAPAEAEEQTPSWKKPSSRLILKGASVSRIILEEREPHKG
jgi:antitoxin (DNA-binding transcriptional repressor) of toxin-antitoxin stability system